MEATVLFLASKGDQRNLIAFVERWAEIGEPTAPARLAEARAFVDLCMMDRAWIRLKELTEAQEGGLDALILTARMFIERGWPNRARKPLELALVEASEDPRVVDLCRRADLPPVPVPESEPDSVTDLDTLLPLAERYLATGSFLKAQRVLERLKRQHPDHRRIADLLWALAGEFSLAAVPLHELVDRLGPDLSQLADLSEEAEHTESVARTTPHDPLDLPEDEANRAFPSLFRTEPGGDADPEATPRPPRDPDTDEVTQTAAMASMADLRREGHPSDAAGRPRPRPDNGLGSVDGDTQIVRVIHRENGSELTALHGAMHVPRDATGSETFDLAAFRREMGMEAHSPGSNSDFDTALEREDDDVIILTRREPDRDAPEEQMNAGLELIEPDNTTSEVRPSAFQTRTPTPLPAPPAPTPAPRAPSKRRRPAVPSSNPWWILIVAFLALVSVVLVVAIVLFHVVATHS
jgi:hypothetical protein